MAKSKDNPRDFATLEQEALLEIHNHAYQHVRSMVTIRSAYFNYYILTVGIASAAYFAAYDPPNSVSSTVVMGLAALIWFVGVFTMMRAERLSGHVMHNIRAIREIQNVLSQRYPSSLGSIIPFTSNPLAGVGPNRRLLSPDRSIEAPATIVGGAASALVIVLSSGLQCWAIAMLFAFLSLTPYALWRREVSHLRTAHSGCCGTQAPKAMWTRSNEAAA